MDESDDVDWVREEGPEEFGGVAGILESGTVKPEVTSSVQHEWRHILKIRVK